MNIKTNFFLLQGESPLENAPSIELENGGHCIPQHYLLYQHSRASVEKIVLDIDYDDRYLIFVCEDKGGIYIQVGLIGFDNYAPLQTQKRRKVVYGRKWRVEPELPTSEIIQTIFLALKKSREHEVRELFRLTHGKLFTSPFNNHHDLPLISQNTDLVRPDAPNHTLGFHELEKQLLSIRYDQAKLQLKGLEKIRPGKWLIDIHVLPTPRGQLPEITDMEISLLLSNLTMNVVYYQLMDKFLSLSDLHVEENFHYKGFARFSRQNSVTAIAGLSSSVRQKLHCDTHHNFNRAFQSAAYETDKSRVPPLYKGGVSDKIKSSLAHYQPLEGILPG